MMRYTVKVLLDDSDPTDAAIMAALQDCLIRRRAEKLRALAAAGLGVRAAAPAPRPPLPTPKPIPATRQMTLEEGGEVVSETPKGSGDPLLDDIMAGLMGWGQE